MNSIGTSTAVVLAAIIFTGVSPESHRIGFDKYHDYKEMTKYLRRITDEFSNISSLYSIGKSVLGMRVIYYKKYNNIFNL